MLDGTSRTLIAKRHPLRSSAGSFRPVPTPGT